MVSHRFAKPASRKGHVGSSPTPSAFKLKLGRINPLGRDGGF